MDIYDYALKMEEDGENYYRDLAKKTDNTGLQNIFNMLANEEAKHFKFLEQISKNNENPEWTETEILSNAKNIFSEMGKEVLKLKSPNPQTELYKITKDIEERSYKFYLDKSNETKSEYQKKVFLRLAAEERKHMVLLENIVEFVSRPESWIENAEFNHLDEY